MCHQENILTHDTYKYFGYLIRLNRVSDATLPSHESEKSLVSTETPSVKTI